MNLKAKRLDKGWSQEDLADAAGVSVRTIQRVEDGQTASLETLKCLAAVFEINISDLVKDTTMTSKIPPQTAFLAEQEKKALEYVSNLKWFYTNIIVFAFVVPCLALFNYWISPQVLWVVYVIIPWLIAILLHAILTFGAFKVFGPDWEQRQFLKHLNGPR